MVAGVIHISDEFELDGKDDGKDAPLFTSSGGGGGGDVVLPGKGGNDFGSGVDYERSEEERESCMNTLAAALGAAVFLMIQCVLIGVWIALCRKRRKHTEVRLSVKFEPDITKSGLNYHLYMANFVQNNQT